MTRFRVMIAAAAMAVISSGAGAEDRPLALVEHVDAPEAEVQPFDYVYANDKIDLRPGGELRLAYFDRCIVETFTGGVIKLKNDDVKISKGGASVQEARPCQTAALSLSADAREAGVSVKRVSPFSGKDWQEVSIAVMTPRFIWPRYKEAETGASVSVYLLEADPVQLVWQGAADGNYLVYPDDAPGLIPGLPYRVIVSFGPKHQTSAVFSIDPQLELPDGLLTTAVPLGL
jgi:hypothetical protein